MCHGPFNLAIERIDRWGRAGRRRNEHLLEDSGHRSSDRASIPSFEKGWRHSPNVCRCTPRSAAALPVGPPVQRRKMQQRSTIERAIRQGRA